MARFTKKALAAPPRHPVLSIAERTRKCPGPRRACQPQGDYSHLVDSMNVFPTSLASADGLASPRAAADGLSAALRAGAGVGLHPAQAAHALRALLRRRDASSPELHDHVGSPRAKVGKGLSGPHTADMAERLGLSPSPWRSLCPFGMHVEPRPSKSAYLI